MDIEKKLTPKMDRESDKFLIACALARVKAISGAECLAMTGATENEILTAINSDECKQLGMRIQTEGFAQEIAAQLDLYRAQLELRARLRDPELSTSALLAISQFLFAIGGMKERRQVRVAESTGPVFSIVQIFDTDSPDEVARKQRVAGRGITIRLPRYANNAPIISDMEGV